MNNPIEEEIDKKYEAAKQLQIEAELLYLQYKNFPDLKIHTDRWGKQRYVSKLANKNVDKFYTKYNCGCCSDSPLELYIYLENKFGRVYADPSYIVVGQKNINYMYSDKEKEYILHNNWQQKLVDMEINPELIHIIYISLGD